MPPIAMQPDQMPEQMPEQAPGDSKQGSQFLPLDPNLSTGSQMIVHAGRKVMLSEKGEEAMMKALSASNNLPNAAAMLILQVIESAMEKIKEKPAESPFGDGGAGEYLMDTLFALARENGVPGAESPEAYEAALDILDDKGQGLFAGSEEPTAEMQAPEQFSPVAVRQ